MARSTAQLSRDLKVKAVVVRSRGGKSAAMVAATRPAAPVLALTTDPAVCRRLNLLWGVVPVVIDPTEFDNPRPVARQLVQQLGLAQPGQCPNQREDGDQEPGVAPQRPPRRGLDRNAARLPQV